MKFIPPLEIASQIMTLIQEAEKELIIVSPYINISNWDKMKKCLRKAVSSGVKITFIARKNAKQDFSELEALGIKPILIDDLHAKVYINESYAIVTSLNMIHYSDINSIDVGYKTEHETERKELINFVKKYVNVKSEKGQNIAIKNITTKIFEKIVFNEYQVDRLYDDFGRNFFNIHFVKAATYVFSDNLLPFGDVMFDSIYTIKIDKSRNDCDEIINKISELNYNFIHEFKVELFTTHTSYYYLYFRPVTAIQLQNLIQDYLNITKTIRESNIHKVMKTQYNKFF